MARGIQQVYYYDNEQIKYIYKKAQYSEENKLIISFSAFSSNGAPPQYSYVRTFEGIDVNQLFVLDTGHRGSYYLGIAPYFTIEKAVVNLIETIIVKENIKRKDIICIGSSKGGWAALYYGIKMNLGYVIAGEPQVFIVDYLKKSKGLDVLDYISNNKTDCYSMINNKLINLLYEKEKLPKLMLHAGSGGYHYQNHVLPFLSNVKSGIIQLDIQEYSEHDNVAKYFPKFLMNNVF